VHLAGAVIALVGAVLKFDERVRDEIEIPLRMPRDATTA
jgi:hypothetical protein